MADSKAGGLSTLGVVSLLARALHEKRPDLTWRECFVIVVRRMRAERLAAMRVLTQRR